MDERREDFFIEVVRARRLSMWRVAYHILRSEADAEDAVSGAVESTWKHLNRIRTEDALPAYLMRSVVNAAHDELRRRKHTVPLEPMEETLKAPDKARSIVDSGDAYFAFRVTGYQPDLKDREYQERPQFRDVDIRMEGLEKVSYIEPRFFDGLDGSGLLADGSVPEKYDRLPYQTENGDMVYIIRMRCDSDDFSFVGKDVKVSLGGLGVESTRHQDVQAEAEGPWEFAWTLKGTDRGLKLDGLDLPLGDTGSVLNAVALQPIHIRMVLRVPRKLESEDPEWSNAPVFRGFRLKDGTVLDMVAGHGIEHYTDETGEDYYMTWELLRAVDPDQVESLRFTALHKDPEDVAESEIFEVGIR